MLVLCGWDPGCDSNLVTSAVGLALDPEYPCWALPHARWDPPPRGRSRKERRMPVSVQERRAELGLALLFGGYRMVPVEDVHRNLPVWKARSLGFSEAGLVFVGEGSFVFVSGEINCFYF